MKTPFESTTRQRLPVASWRQFGLVELASASGLTVQLLPTGSLFAVRHGSTLINQLLPGPAEEGLFRLLLRWRDGETWRSEPLVGPTVAFATGGPGAAAWTRTLAGWTCRTVLQVHPQKNAWRWRIEIANTSATPAEVDVVLSHDLGLADEGAVRNNEAYTSHYIDLLPWADPALGWVLLARQNQAMSGGRHPWLGLTCLGAASAFATDGTQVFGVDHRLTGHPVAARTGLPSQRLQGEFAVLALQSRPQVVPPQAHTVIEFLACFEPDHPAASDEADVQRIRRCAQLDWPAVDGGMAARPAQPGVFARAAWQHGEEPTADDLAAWFPGARRHEERDDRGVLQSFFVDDCTHVVTRAKEAVVPRPHGHILRSGEALWLERDHFGLTAYAAGVFAAQAYVGNTNLARLLTVVRNPLNLTRAAGQRVFLREAGHWRQLGVPSAFELRPGQLRWWYRCGHDTVLRATVWCSRRYPAGCLALDVLTGPPQEFLVTHELALGANEFDHSGEVSVRCGGSCLLCRLDPDSVTVRSMPELGFVIAAATAAPGVVAAGDAPLYEGGGERGGPYATLQFAATRRAGVILLGAEGNDSALLAALAAARSEFDGARGLLAQPPPAAVRLHAADPAVARLDDVLPWLSHNAWIHFSAPHGLEQYGGAAWGVRDVCQGSVEWLLAAGEYAAVRRILTTVFARQFPDGDWPQWFMHDPFRWIQSHHSHGDVCFWPVKALCDYVEATGDLAILSYSCRYSRPEDAAATGPSETLLAHGLRVVRQVVERFVAHTALVNYGDGDWDDTLQPADPGMRTRMVSAWTVALAYHTFRQLAEVARRAGEETVQDSLEEQLRQMGRDFRQRLMPDGITAGFLVREADGDRVLLHPRDEVTGIRYRLLPMTRAILAELFTPEEAERHLRLIREHLLYADGARLMSEPARYQGGRERLFKRGDTAANVGREIGLQYVHAHLRYAEALAKVGDAAGLWRALQVVNPVGLREVVPHASARQANVYFSSSDADFPDRQVAAERWQDLRSGRVAVRGGWRLYSSGPGLFLHKVRACLLGLRESWDDVVFDPVLPAELDGLVAEARLLGRPVRLHYHVGAEAGSVATVRANGVLVSDARREPNPYRTGGLRVARATLERHLRATDNLLEIAT